MQSSIVKNNLKRDFSQIPNALIEDEQLSDRARFVYVYFASRPDGWQFFNPQLCKVLGYGEETLRKYLKQLHEAGWLINHGQSKNERGHWSCCIYELMAFASLDYEPLLQEDIAHYSAFNFSGSEKTGDSETSGHSNKEYINNMELDSNKKINVTREKATSDAIKVANYLNEKIKAECSKFVAKPKAWVADIERCIRVDQRTIEDLTEIIDWIYSDQGVFWRSNILSGKKLRQKYNQMLLQKINPVGQPAVDECFTDEYWDYVDNC